MLSPSALQELQGKLTHIEADLADIQEQAELLRAVIARFGPKSSQRSRAKDGTKLVSTMQHIRDAAELVLQDAGEPLHYRDIHARLVKRAITVNGKDPARVLGAQLSADHTRFKPVGGGKWTLVAGFPERQPVSRPEPVRLEPRPSLPLARTAETRPEAVGAAPPRPVIVPRQLPPVEDGAMPDAPDDDDGDFGHDEELEG